MYDSYVSDSLSSLLSKCLRRSDYKSDGIEFQSVKGLYFINVPSDEKHGVVVRYYEWKYTQTKIV